MTVFAEAAAEILADPTGPFAVTRANAAAFATTVSAVTAAEILVAKRVLRANTQANAATSATTMFAISATRAKPACFPSI
jgi:hypothetical protein